VAWEKDVTFSSATHAPPSPLSSSTACTRTTLVKRSRAARARRRDAGGGGGGDGVVCECESEAKCMHASTTGERRLLFFRGREELSE
jgi:hypothetical protein